MCERSKHTKPTKFCREMWLLYHLQVMRHLNGKYTAVGGFATTSTNIGARLRQALLCSSVFGSSFLYIGHAVVLFRFAIFSSEHERDRQALVGRSFASVIVNRSINQATRTKSTKPKSSTAKTNATLALEPYLYDLSLYTLFTFRARLTPALKEQKIKKCEGEAPRGEWWLANLLI